MSKDYKVSGLEIWLHERTGDFYIVPDEGFKCVGPFQSHQILREYRIAIEPFEYILAIPNFYEHYNPIELPYPASDFIVLEDDWIPDSITEYNYSDIKPALLSYLRIDWIKQENLAFACEEIKELLSHVHMNDIDVDSAMFGLVEKRWEGHPPKSGIVCRDFKSDEKFAVIDVAPRRQWVMKK